MSLEDIRETAQCLHRPGRSITDKQGGRREERNAPSEIKLKDWKLRGGGGEK